MLNIGVSKIDRFSPQAMVLLILQKDDLHTYISNIWQLSDEISLLKNREIMRRKVLFRL